MKWILILLLLAAPAAAETPHFTVRCDYDGWTCHDGFPAISRDSLTIANVVLRDDKLVTEFISVASSRVVRRVIAFDPGTAHKIPTVDRVAKLHRELRAFRSMSLESEDAEHDITVYKLGTVTLTINYCETDCQTSYRVQRRRR